MYAFSQLKGDATEEERHFALELAWAVSMSISSPATTSKGSWQLKMPIFAPRHCAFSPKI